MQIIIEIDDIAVKALSNDLTDVELWVRMAVAGKINQCRKRFIKEWTPKLIADPEVISTPADADAFIEFVVQRPDYQNRKQRDEADELIEVKRLANLNKDVPL